MALDLGFSPNVPENVRDVRTIDLDRLLGGPGNRGAALLAVDPHDGLPQRSSLLTVTDLGVSAEVSRFGSLVWVTHLSTGAPVAGASVSLQGVAKSDLATATTDSYGLATFPAGDWLDSREERRERLQPYFFVRAGADWTYAKVERARASYGTGVDLDVRADADWAGTGLRRSRGLPPGRDDEVAGVFRKVDVTGVKIVPDQDARVLVEDAQGEKVFDGRAKLGSLRRARDSTSCSPRRATSATPPSRSQLGESRPVVHARRPARRLQG